MKFGDNLRNLRVRRKLTQMELAEALGTSQSSITAWECGTRQPDFSTVARISQFFNVPMSALIPSAEGMDISYVDSVAESLHQNPKLRMLFDRSKYLSDADLDAVLTVVNAITRERASDD